MPETATTFFNQGRLTDAVARAVETVKAKPADVSARWLLAELLCFTGDMGRVDTQLETIAQMDTKTAVGVSLFRGLLRGEEARTQFYASGRVPEVIETPSAEMKSRLEALLLLREGQAEKAAGALQHAEEQRPKIKGQCDGIAFDDFRDLDDLVGGMLEVFTGEGKFYWIPFSKIESLEFEKPERPRDLLWRKAKLAVRAGPGGEVHVPALYAGSHVSGDQAIKLGRSTDWKEDKIVRGSGQRMFMIGEDAKGIMEIGSLSFDLAPSPGTPGEGGGGKGSACGFAAL